MANVNKTGKNKRVAGKQNKHGAENQRKPNKVQSLTKNYENRKRHRNDEIHNDNKPIKKPKLIHSLLELENGTGAVPNELPFDCPICFVDVDKHKGVTLRECLHNLCRECLINTVKHSEDAEVRCPCTEGTTPCDGFLQYREIRSVVPHEVLEAHLNHSVQLAESRTENSFHCQTVDCGGWIEFEPGVTNFHCPVCRHQNCINCRAVHEGMDCLTHQQKLRPTKEYKSTSNYLQKQMKSGNAMECPKCKIILTKQEGCDSIICSMCGLEICWATKGPRWGPKGHGDISGGCRCMVLGKRCHPKCRNCH